MTRPYIDNWSPPPVHEQRWCQYVHVAGKRKGHECGRFLRKAGTIVCGIHRGREVAVAARRKHLAIKEVLEEDAQHRLDVADVTVADVTVADVGTDWNVEDVGDSVEDSESDVASSEDRPSRPLSPSRFRGAPWSGVLERNRRVLGPGIDEALSNMPAPELKRVITALETKTWNADPEVGQALYEELIRLRASIV